MEIVKKQNGFLAKMPSNWSVAWAILCFGLGTLNAVAGFLGIQVEAPLLLKLATCGFVLYIALTFFNIALYRIKGYEQVEVNSNELKFSRVGLYSFDKLQISIRNIQSISKYSETTHPPIGQTRGQIYYGNIEGRVILFYKDKEKVKWITFGQKLPPEDCEILIREIENWI